MKQKVNWPIYTVDPVTGEEIETLYEVTCGLTNGDPGCRTMANGDPGWPPSGPECEIQEIRLRGGGPLVSVADWEEFGFDDHQIASISDAAFKLADEAASN